MSRNFKKILITGISGSGGSYLAEHILKKKKNLKIFGFFRNKENLDNVLKKKIITHKVDMNNFDNLKAKIKKINPDLIYHLATHAHVRESFDKPILTTANNTIITVNLLEAIRKLKIKPLIIICSSSEVYGAVLKKDMPINEQQRIAPINPYAATKAFQDFIAQIYHNSFKLKIIITRMFSYTNARNEKLFQTAFAKKVIQIENFKIQNLNHGNLSSIRTILDKDDAMEAYWLTATKGHIGEVYNIGGGKTISVKNYLKELIKLSKFKIITQLDKKLLRPQDIKIQMVDSSKFKKDTGWKPMINFNDSVKKVLKECREIYFNSKNKP
jgi:GDP-mannose 4,6-dehydratase